MHGDAMDARPARPQRPPRLPQLPQLPQLQDALAVLAAPRRFDLLVLMLLGERRSVSQLAEAVKLSQSCTTRHLQALARAGLVKGEREGKRVVFRIAPRDQAASAVLASIAGGSGGVVSAGGVEPARAPAPRRPRRRRTRERSSGSEVLLAATRIESAADFEPLMAEDGDMARGPDPDQRRGPESGRTSEPEAAPAWQRSDLEDFLL